MWMKPLYVTKRQKKRCSFLFSISFFCFCFCFYVGGLGSQQTQGGVKVYLSSVAYATPQDSLFQAGAFQPLVLYFHTLSLTPVAT